MPVIPYEQRGYVELLDLAMSMIPDTVDKRQGSIIYDSLAPFCYALAQYYIDGRQMDEASSLQSARGEDLDNLALLLGITRDLATVAIRKGYIEISDLPAIGLPLGTRFSVPDTDPMVVYRITGGYPSDVTPDPGYYILGCTEAGSKGNTYTGPVSILDNIPNVSLATLLDIIVPGSNEESDNEFRARLKTRLGAKPFGGNVAQYREWLLATAGVVACQVYPVWAGGGTVKGVILAAGYVPASADFIDYVQTLMDPIVNTGLGLGNAPIDHQVTIATAQPYIVNVEATIIPESGYTVAQLEPSINTALAEVFLQLRQDWGIYPQQSLGLYVSRIVSTIVGVPHVVNTTGVTLNGSTDDIIFTETGTQQDLPTIGTVVLQ